MAASVWVLEDEELIEHMLMNREPKAKQCLF
jgi:hypothetical protein